MLSQREDPVHLPWTKGTSARNQGRCLGCGAWAAGSPQPFPCGRAQPVAVRNPRRPTQPWGPCLLSGFAALGLGIIREMPIPYWTAGSRAPGSPGAFCLSWGLCPTQPPPVWALSLVLCSSSLLLLWFLSAPHWPSRPSLWSASFSPGQTAEILRKPAVPELKCFGLFPSRSHRPRSGGLPRAVRGRDGSHLGPRSGQESVLPNPSFPQKWNAPWDSAQSGVRCGKLEECDSRIWLSELHPLKAPGLPRACPETRTEGRPAEPRKQPRLPLHQLTGFCSSTAEGLVVGRTRGPQLSPPDASSSKQRTS